MTALSESKSVLHAEVMLLGQSWQLRYERGFDELLRTEGAVDSTLRRRLERIVRPAKRGSYRYPLTYRTVPLLLQVEPRRRQIGVYSWRGSAELFLERHGDDDEELLAHVRPLKQAEDESAPLDLDLPEEEYQLPDFDSRQFQGVYERTLKNEKQLLALIDTYRPGLMEQASDGGLSLTARYVLVRNHLLKFLAILPSLDHDQSGVEVKRILLEALRRLREENRQLEAGDGADGEEPLPGRFIVPIVILYWLVRIFPAGMVAPVVRGGVRLMARRFIAGETIQSATHSLRELRRTGREATLDQLGELVVSEEEADGYRDKVLELIAGCADYVPAGERNAAGIYSAHVSIKVTALASQFVPEAFDYTYSLVAPRLREILLAAKHAKVFINIDAEHYHVRDLVFRIYRKVLLETRELRDFDGTGIVVQAYLRDAARHLEDVIALAKERRRPMPIRLVKGAYWDAETIEAEAHSYKAPQFLNKEETDIYFRQLVYRIFQSHPHVTLCLASHNIFDHAFARALHKELFSELPPFEHQCLHMTFEALSTALAHWGVPTRNYVPVGSLLVGMAYLVRRIMENSSQVGFLTQMRDRDIEKVLIPTQLLDRRRDAGELTRDSSRQPSSAFRSVSPVQLYRAPQRRAFEEAILSCRRAEPSSYANPFEPTGAEHEVRSPSDPELVVGRIRFGSRGDVDRALQQLACADDDWNIRGAGQRASCLVRAAQILTIRRLKIAALVLVEAGKSMREALADVDEAIDFLNLYARAQVELDAHLEAVRSREIAAVISPWNFPIAIPCGMVSAALVAGNRVVLKSAEQSPLVAQVLTDVLHEAGVPRSALVHLPGLGEEVGAALVEDSRVQVIAFTGSKAVGTHIARSAGASIRGGLPTRVITEMGGKNAVIVTGSAELDETVAGCLYSAFAHGGQKCSALSRILVDASVKDRFCERFAKAAADLYVGAAWDPATFVNPVITVEDRDRLRAVASRATREAEEHGGRVLVDRSREALPGNALGPVVVELPAERMLAADSESRKEHFGPVVHIVPWTSREQAVQLFNGVEYGLTGGVFSQSQDDIDFLLTRLQCGNLYVNRSCTGARVGIEPFGGFKLSGTGPKAGHAEYLPAFQDFDRMRALSGAITYGHPQPPDPGDELGVTLAKLDEQDVDDLLSLVADHEEHDVQTLWRDYIHWASRNLARWLREGELNVSIPGQLSRNDFSLPRPSATLVVSSNEIHYTSWQALISGALLGTKTRVLLDVPPKSQGDLKSAWQRKLNQLKRVGLPVALADDGAVEASSLILDGDDAWLRGWLERVYRAPSFASDEHPWMPQVLTPGDGPHARDYPALFRRFVLVRSLAINTMRHGAPLE